MSTSELQPSINYFVIALFALFVFVGAIVGFTVSSNVISESNSITIMSIYLVAIAMGWLAFGRAKGLDGLENGLYVVVVGTPVIVLALTLSSIAFWFALWVFVALGVYSVIRIAKPSAASEQIFLALYASWVIIGVIVTLGSTSFLPYAESAMNLAEYYTFLSIRIVVTALLVAALLAKAMLDAYRGPKIRVPELGDLRIKINKNSRSPLDALMQPITVVVNGVLIVLQKLTMAIWSVTVYVGVFLYRTGVNLAEHVREIVMNSLVWFAIARVLATFVMLLVFALFVYAAAPSLVGYVRHDTSLLSLAGSDIFSLVVTFLLFLMTTCFISIAYIMWEVVDGSFDAATDGRSLLQIVRQITDEPLTLAALGGAMVLLGTGMSSLTLYLLVKLVGVAIPGFETLGIYTLLMIVVVAGALCFQIARSIGVKSPDPA